MKSVRWVRLAAVAASVAVMVVGCGAGGAKGAASPADLAAQVIATCADVTDPEVDDFAPLFPTTRLLASLPASSPVRQEADPAADVRRISDSWQVILDFLTSEDALNSLTVKGEPTVADQAGLSVASIAVNYGSGGSTFEIAAARIKGAWYITGVRLDETAPGEVF